MKYDKKICTILSKLAEKVPHNIREGKIHQIPTYTAKVVGTYAQNSVELLTDLLNMEIMTFGSWGECGLVIFFDAEFHEILRMAFEESNDVVRGWIIK